MVIVDHLLQGSDSHRATSHIIDTTTLIGITVLSIRVAIGDWCTAFLCRLCPAKAFLVLHVFLLEQQMVVDSLHSQVS